MVYVKSALLAADVVGGELPQLLVAQHLPVLLPLLQLDRWERQGLPRGPAFWLFALEG